MPIPLALLDAVPIDPPLAQRVRWMLALARELGAMSGDGRRRLGRLLGELQARFDATAACATTFRTTATDTEVIARVERHWSAEAELCRARWELHRLHAPGLMLADEPRADGIILSALVAESAGRSTRVDLYRAPGKFAFMPADAAWVTLILESAVALDVGPQARLAGRLEALSPRERETLDHLLVGASEKQVATRIGRSPHTVHAYVKRIYRHLNVTSRAELLATFVGDQTQRAAGVAPAAGREM